MSRNAVAQVHKSGVTGGDDEPEQCKDYPNEDTIQFENLDSDSQMQIKKYAAVEEESKHLYSINESPETI